MKNLHMKIYIILMFISGVLQLSIFNISWEYFRIIQATHIVSSTLVSILLLIPYVNKHTYEYMIIKKAKSTSGVMLGVILFIIILSGFYLFIIGNPGSDTFGIYAYYIHLYGSFILMFFLFLHVKKKIASLHTALFLVLVISISNPTLSYAKSSSKLTNIELEDGINRYHNEDWTNSAKCKSCHSEIFNQWADSNHRHLVGTNPYYMVMENLAEEDMGEGFRRWCMGCHNPSAITVQQTRTTHEMNGNNMPNILFESGSKTLIDTLKTHGNSRLEQGVSCITCHRITKTTSSGNSSYTLDLTNRKKYALEESSSKVGQWLSEKFINANPKTHKESYSNSIYKTSAYCASCHDEFLPDSKKEVVSTFKEWEKSSYNNPDDKSKHKTCIDCHMTYLKDNKFSPLKGTSTTGGTIKDNIKVHYFAGSNHFLSGLKNKTNENQTIQLLRTSAKLHVDIKDKKILVGVKNVGAGHHLPTGVSDFRELWLDITLRDRDSKIIFSSGKLKSDGNLDNDARPFMKIFGDENSKPVGLLFWRYKKLLSDTRIPAGEERIESFDISDIQNIKYPLKIDVKLNFRIYPQWVTNIVKKAYPALPDPPVIILENIQKDFL